MTQTLTIQTKNSGALKVLNSLAERHFIKIVDDFHAGSGPARRPRKFKAYRNWIMDAENAPMMELKKTKAKWISKIKQLQNLSRSATSFQYSPVN